MITEKVIEEIYKKYGRKRKDSEPDIPYYIEMLAPHHNIVEDEDEIIIRSLDQFNPFRRFLKRALLAILEFDKDVAFVFKNHILFLSRSNPDIRIHIRLKEKKPSFFSRLFGKSDE